jgi:hypothetical protein
MPNRSVRLFVRRACVRIGSLGVLTLLGVAVASAPVATQVVEHHAASAAVVIDWNRILNEAFAVPGAHPATIFFPRPYAMMHVAMFDAINSIELRYQPYHVRARAEPGASADAAAAQAAHDVLTALMPSQSARFDAALATSLGAVSPAAAASGAAVGAAVARAILDLRQNDGWTRTPPEYVLPGMPGYWQPTPPNNPAATLGHYPDVTGFVLDGSQQFVPAPPPALSSEQYATDFNQVKTLGSVNSTARTAEQTMIARTVAGVGTTTTPNRLWNLILADLARSRQLSGIDTARAFALLNMTTHDGLRVSFNGKFLYGLWRPVTAIREADRDGNPATAADATWLPLITTPPYPSYPGNISCIATASADVLTHVFGRDDIPFTVTWPDAAGAAVSTRSYNGFRQLADECAMARIWAGIHFEFDQSASKGVCTQVADYVVDNTLRPLP